MIFKTEYFPNIKFDGKKVLDIGCGRNKIPGALGLDYFEGPGVDIVHNLNDGLPLEDSLFDIVVATQVLEHIENVVDLVYEVHRVLKPGGIFIAHCPYFRSSWAWIDPTHRRAFSYNSLDYFCENTWFFKQYRFRGYGFKSIEVYLDRQEKSGFVRNLMRRLCAVRPFRFENSFLSNLFVFQEVSFILKK